MTDFRQKQLEAQERLITASIKKWVIMEMRVGDLQKAKNTAITNLASPDNFILDPIDTLMDKIRDYLLEEFEIELNEEQWCELHDHVNCTIHWEKRYEQR